MAKRMITIGYQILVDLHEKTNIKNDSGIIISNTNHHPMRSGTVISVGSLAKKETPELVEGSVVHFYETDVKTVNADNKSYYIVPSNAIKLIEIE